MTKLTKTEVLARLYEILATKEDMDAFEALIAEKTIDLRFRRIHVEAIIAEDGQEGK